MITCVCPSCNAALKAPAARAGGKAKCPACGGAVRVPKASAVREFELTEGDVAEAPGRTPHGLLVPQFRCPRCGSADRPLRKKAVAGAGWALFVVLLVLFFPLCWLGLLLTEDCQECAGCGLRVG